IMKEMARITSTPFSRICRRFPASSSAVREPARKTFGSAAGSSVPNRRIFSDGSFVIFSTFLQSLLNTVGQNPLALRFDQDRTRHVDQDLSRGSRSLDAVGGKLGCDIHAAKGKLHECARPGGLNEFHAYRQESLPRAQRRACRERS